MFNSGTGRCSSRTFETLSGYKLISSRTSSRKCFHWVTSFLSIWTSYTFFR